MRKLIIILLLTTNILFGGYSKKILVSNQVTYTLAKNVTKNTDIEVIPVFDAYTSLLKQKYSFKNLENKDEIFKDVDAVITFSKEVKDDFLYEEARRYNIGVIDIDLTYSYQDNSSLVLSKKLKDNGDTLEYVWLDFTNINKMISILENDLSRIYPNYEKQFKINAKELKLVFIELYNNFLTKIYEKDYDLALIQLSNSELDYFLDSLEIYRQNLTEDITEESILRNVKETGITKFVSSKSISKKTREILKKHNLEFLKLNSAIIPNDLDNDEKMDENGFIDILKDNLNKLLIFLTK